jgi:23S rRNA (adenine2030-N6)-methyltransferase
MLSYRHGFHAGNFADVLKHFLLTYVLEYLKKKDNSFVYIDANAGAGKYLIDESFMQKNKEYLNGIDKILKTEIKDKFINNYLNLVKTLNPNKYLTIYPGSCWFAQQMLRPKDRMHFLELHKNEFVNLENNFKNHSKIIIENEDCYKRLVKLLPPIEKRGVILIDPSYELKDEYEKTVELIENSLKKFNNGTYLIWYPILENKKFEILTNALENLNLKSYSHIQMIIDKHAVGLQGSGVFIINPPFSIKADLKHSLQLLLDILKNKDSDSKIEFKNSIQ